MQLSANPGKFIYLQWVLATSVGLALSLFLYFFLFEPAFASVPGAQAFGVYLFRWPHLVPGIVIAIAQSLVIRQYTRGLAAWMIATTVGWTFAIRAASRLFESTFNSMVGSSGPNASTILPLLLAELLSGILFGLIIGLAQWFALRKNLLRFSRWMTLNVLGWTAGLLVEGFLVMFLALRSGDGVPPLPAILGFEHIFRGEFNLSAQPFSYPRDELAIIFISLFVGGVTGAMTGYAISPNSLTLFEEAIVHLKKQKLAVKLSGGIGAALILLGLGLFAFLAMKEFDALMLSRTYDTFLTPVTGGGGGGCFRNIVLQPERRVIKESESMPLYAKLPNDTGIECQVELKLLSPDFELSPAETSQTVSIPPDQTATLMWVITPKRLGTYSIGLSNGMTVQTVAVSVVNTFGLNVQQAKLLSILGTFFGPALTFPWLFSLWQQRRENAQRQTAEEQINNLRREIDELKRRKKRVK